MKFGFISTIALVMSILLPCSDFVRIVSGYASQDPPISAPIRSDTSPVVSAVLLECPKERSSQYMTRDSQQKSATCEPQLMVNIRVNPSYHIERMEKFLVLDEVYDPKKRSKAKILAPYLIEINRGEPVMMYPLEFNKNVKCESCDSTPPHASTKNFNDDSNCKTVSPGQESLNRIVDRLASVFPSATKSCSANSANAMNPSADTAKLKNDDYELRNQKRFFEDRPNYQDANYDDSDQWVEVKSKKRYGQKQLKRGGYFNDFPNSSKGNCDANGSDKLGKAGIVPPLDSKLRKCKKFAQLGLLKLRENATDHGSCNQNAKRDNVERTIEYRKPFSQPILNDDGITMELPPIVSDASLIQNSNDDDSDAFVQDAVESNAVDILDKKSEASIHDNIEDYNDDALSVQYHPVKKRKRIGVCHKKRKPKSKFKKQMGAKKQSSIIDSKNKGKTEEPNDKNIIDTNIDECECESKDNGYKPKYDPNLLDLSLDGLKEKIKSELDADPSLNVINNLNKERFAKRRHFKNKIKDPIETFDESFDEYSDLEQTPNIPRNGEEKFLLDNRLKKEPTDYAEEDFIEPEKIELQQQKRQQERKHKQQQVKYQEGDESDEQPNLDRNNVKHNKMHKQSQSRNFDYDYADNQHQNEVDNINLNSNNNNNNDNYDNNYYERPYSKKHPYEDKLTSNEVFDDRNNFNFHNGNRNNKNGYYNKNTLSNEPELNQYNPIISPIMSTDTLIDRSVKRAEGRMKSTESKEFARNKGYSNSMFFNDARQQQRPSNYRNEMSFSENNARDNNRREFVKVFPVVKPLSEYKRKQSKVENEDEINFDVRLQPSLYNQAPPSNHREIDYERYSSLSDPLPKIKPETATLVPRIYQPPKYDFISSYDYGYAVTPTAIPMHKIYQQKLTKEHSKYLPAKVPYESIFEDPFLNIKDKLSVINVIDRYDAAKDESFKKLKQEAEKPNSKSIISPYAYTPHYIKLRDMPNTQKTKRSYLFYDDLEMRDALDDLDSDERMQPQPQVMSSRHVETDVQPCNTCGGKGKKPKTDSTVTHAQESSCRCQSDTEVCTCQNSRTSRSVSDTWYSVFNMSAPLPFLTTKMSVFRKRHNTWWKIAPSITLSSLSGIFANANLSILFSSHVDIFQLEKSLRLQNHKLLIPKDNGPTPITPKNSNLTNLMMKQNMAPKLNELKADPHSILTMDNDKLEESSDHRENNEDISNTNSNILSDNHKLCDEIRETLTQNRLVDKHDSGVSMDASKLTKRQNGNGKKTRGSCVETIGDFGYFPVSMNVLERCPNDQSRLCLNLLDDKVPAFNIKIKIPFRENLLLHKNVFKVQVTNVITDATTKDALQISVDVINVYFEAREFTVSIGNCPTAYGGATKTSVTKILVPQVGETVSFLLPFVSDTTIKHKRLTCDVIVTTMGERSIMDKSNLPQRNITKIKKSADQQNSNGIKKTVAIRQLIVEQDSRCFCIWKCNCHCVQKVETHVDFSVCKKLSLAEEMESGLKYDDSDTNNIDLENNSIIKPIAKILPKHQIITKMGTNSVFIYAFFLLALMLLLGILKALLGLCFKAVGKWGYNYVQPGKTYCEASICRRFIVNTFFFVMFPFLFWCKCFTPSEEDLLVASTEWHCSTVDDKFQLSGDEYLLQDSMGCEDDEDELFVQSDRSKYNSDRVVGGTDIYLKERGFLELPLDLKDACNDDDEDEDEDEENTKFVLQVLAESRECLKKLSSHNSRNASINDTLTKNEIEMENAHQLIEALKNAQIVYRVFDKPIGNAQNIAPGTKYSIQGYFLPSIGAEYEFVNYNPLVQYRYVTPHGFVGSMHPPVVLIPNEFSRVYENKIDVLRSADLKVFAPIDAPCINIAMNNNEVNQALLMHTKSQADLESAKTSKILPNDILKFEPRPYPFSQLSALDEKDETGPSEPEYSDLETDDGRATDRDEEIQSEDLQALSYIHEDTKPEEKKKEEMTADTYQQGVNNSLDSTTFIDNVTLDLVEDMTTDTTERTDA